MHSNVTFNNCIKGVSEITELLVSHRVGGNRKRNQQSTKADQKSIEAVFSIAICRQEGDKWQSKMLFLSIFDLLSSIELAFSIAAFPVRV